MYLLIAVMIAATDAILLTRGASIPALQLIRFISTFVVGPWMIHTGDTILTIMGLGLILTDGGLMLTQ
jgi:hypothetical protein